MNPYSAIFLSSIFWVVATQLYAYLGKKMSTFRLTFYKSFISFVCFFLLSLFTADLFPSAQVIGLLLLSGLLGFGLGDLFIFYSFSKMGPARTLLLMSFNPFIIGLLSATLLDISLKGNQILGLILLCLCLIFQGVDKKSRGKFQLKTALMALTGIFLDALGIIYSKKAFMLEEQLTSQVANAYRIFVATIFLAFVLKYYKHPFPLKDISPKDKKILIFASFMGTFLALLFYLYGLSKGNPAIVAALAGLAPIYAAIYEHIRDKEKPSPLFILSFLCMIGGVIIIVRSDAL